MAPRFSKPWGLIPTSSTNTLPEPLLTEGIGINEIARESQMRHDEAYNPFADANALNLAVVSMAG